MSRLDEKANGVLNFVAFQFSFLHVLQVHSNGNITETFRLTFAV